MIRELRRRVERIEAAFALPDFSRMTNEELLALAGTDCEGVPWSVFTVEELETMAHSGRAAAERVIKAARPRLLAGGRKRHEAVGQG